MTSYIRHVMLHTGDHRDVYLDDVDAAAVAVCGDLLDKIAQDGGTNQAIPLPQMPGVWVTGRDGGRCISVTVWAEGPPAELLMSVSVAAHRRCGLYVWQALHEASSLPVTDPDLQPNPPWCATLIAPAYRRIVEPDPVLHIMMGALASCIGWAWMLRADTRNRS